MSRYVKGVTLTPEERRQAGFAPASSTTPTTPAQSPTGLVKAHSCSVTLPEGTSCECAYTRFGRLGHAFAYQAPVYKTEWHRGSLPGGVSALETKAQDLASSAFRAAQQQEQIAMRRRTPPKGYESENTLPTANPLRQKEAERCAGCYTVCLRFPSGTLVPLGTLYEQPDKAIRDLACGSYQTSERPTGQELVIGICCRWRRCWQPARFIALPPSEPSSSVPLASSTVAQDVSPPFLTQPDPLASPIPPD